MIKSTLFTLLLLFSTDAFSMIRAFQNSDCSGSSIPFASAGMAEMAHPGRFKSYLRDGRCFLEFPKSSSATAQVGIKVTYYFTNGSSVTKFGGSRSWRNNNPGNISHSDFTLRHGAIGHDGRFAIFRNPLDGFNAIKRLLNGGSYRNLSIADAIARYSPAHENPTSAYVRFVSNDLGLPSHTILNTFSSRQMHQMANAIVKFEKFEQGAVK
ncbi:hypothetical protein D5018_19700 [Parashewanella curva]|uniref:Uncharacterized protein n=1 Tax=Parashewanella curva TaxID=2338552 RepID=A0A3L8PRE8_9GAMM|nr:hypothetical protein [Parashewanella curva]RLV57971.1 hypothetical protein D5018_19700 [Parashewanella curva]